MQSTVVADADGPVKRRSDSGTDCRLLPVPFPIGTAGPDETFEKSMIVWFAPAPRMRTFSGAIVGQAESNRNVPGGKVISNAAEVVAVASSTAHCADWVDPAVVTPKSRTSVAPVLNGVTHVAAVE